MKTIVIIPAGGHGSRFQSKLPKQYHLLSGKPIIIRTIQAFLSCDSIEKIVINISPDFRDFLLEEFNKNGIDSSRIELLTFPGKERQETVLNALNKSEYVKSSEIILVHDAVRCMISKDLINRTIEELSESTAVCPGLVPKNTIKKVNTNSISEETIDRSILREIQTPQGFKKEIIERAYSQAKNDNFLGTDSSSLVERLGTNVKVIEGEEQNFKITTPMDFVLAEFLLTKQAEKYMIIGSKGQLGKEFVKHCEKNGILYSAYDIKELDVCDANKVARTIAGDQPSVILNCSAYNNVDAAEKDFITAHAVNAQAPKILAENAKQIGAKFIHYSTDFVFDGTAKEPYSEDSSPNPINEYGKSKFLGEENIKAIGGDYIIIRTSRVFGDGQTNFPYRFKQWAKDKDVLTIADDVISCSTSTTYLAEKTIMAIQCKHKGILHIVENEPMSLYLWAKLIAKEEKINVTVTPVSQADFKNTAPRPKYSVLKSKFNY
jgi:dTDP-4-dehydrorhamnose reductase